MDLFVMDAPGARPLIFAGKCFSAAPLHTCLSLECPHPSDFSPFFSSPSPSLPGEQHSCQSLLLCLCFMEVHSRPLFAHHGSLTGKAKPHPSLCGQAPSPGPVWDTFAINVSRVNQWLLVRNKRVPTCRIVFLETDTSFFKAEVILQIPLQFSSMVQGHPVLALQLPSIIRVLFTIKCMIRCISEVIWLTLKTLFCENRNWKVGVWVFTFALILFF